MIESVRVVRGMHIYGRRIKRVELLDVDDNVVGELPCTRIKFDFDASGGGEASLVLHAFRVKLVEEA